MRWLALAVALALVACESQVVVTPTATPSSSPAATSTATTPSPTASAAPTKVALRPIPSMTPPSRLVSYELGSDIPSFETQMRFLLTADGRLVTEAHGELVERRLTPAGAATVLLQAIQTGFFDKDASYPREPLPGTTPLPRGPTWIILVVANSGREVRVSVEPTGQPDDEQLYQKSATREKLTALARGYDDLSWLPANQWAEPRPQPYQPAFHRLFVHIEPTLAVPGRPSIDAEATWPFLTAIETVGERLSGLDGTPWRCVVLVDDDARVLGDALARPGAITRYTAGMRSATADLAWRGSGTLRLRMSPLLPHEAATCTGAFAPPF